MGIVVTRLHHCAIKFKKCFTVILVYSLRAYLHWRAFLTGKAFAFKPDKYYEIITAFIHYWLWLYMAKSHSYFYGIFQLEYLLGTYSAKSTFKTISTFISYIVVNFACRNHLMLFTILIQLLQKAKRLIERYRVGQTLITASLVASRIFFAYFFKLT